MPRSFWPQALCLSFSAAECLALGVEGSLGCFIKLMKIGDFQTSKCIGILLVLNFLWKFKYPGNAVHFRWLLEKPLGKIIYNVVLNGPLLACYSPWRQLLLGGEYCDQNNYKQGAEEHRGSKEREGDICGENAKPRGHNQNDQALHIH